MTIIDFYLQLYAVDLGIDPTLAFYAVSNKPLDHAISIFIRTFFVTWSSQSWMPAVLLVVSSQIFLQTKSDHSTWSYRVWQRHPSCYSVFLAFVTLLQSLWWESCTDSRLAHVSCNLELKGVCCSKFHTPLFIDLSLIPSIIGQLSKYSTQPGCVCCTSKSFLDW